MPIQTTDVSNKKARGSRGYFLPCVLYFHEEEAQEIFKILHKLVLRVNDNDNWHDFCCAWCLIVTKNKHYALQKSCCCPIEQYSSIAVILSGILLDANECVYGSNIPIEGEHHRYPCPYNLELKQKIAEFRGVKRNQVFLGVGSDEAIDMIMRVFCAPAQDSILVTPPTYDMYEVTSNKTSFT